MKILIVEDEDILRISIGDDLKEAGFDVSLSKSPKLALNLLEKENYDVAVLDFKLPEMNGIELLKEIKERQSECVVIIMTAYGTIQNAVEAMKIGAYDFITKPFSNKELILTLNRISEFLTLKKENIDLKRKLEEKHQYHNIIGKSKQMKQIFELLEILAHSDSSVLITGETGSGKEMVADAIHYSGIRKNGPYIKVSCALLTRDILESELFGHKRGAFTGAVSDKKGRFELADGGTIFLDDVDDIPLTLQVKLLRVLENKDFELVGGTDTIKVDVRVIAATKENLLEKVKKGEFREDLFYRLNVVPVYIPPLRERKEDIPLLLEAFTERYSSENKVKIAKQALDCLFDYSWPGNVRELKNFVERLAIISRGKEISLSLLPSEMLCKDIVPEVIKSNEDTFDSIMNKTEVNLLKQALDMANGNKAQAARLLKLKLSTFRSKMEKYGLM